MVWKTVTTSLVALLHRLPTTSSPSCMQTKQPSPLLLMSTVQSPTATLMERSTYAHAGTWHKLANDADLLTTIAALDAEAIARAAADTTLQGNIDTVAANLATEITDRGCRRYSNAFLSKYLHRHRDQQSG